MDYYERKAIATNEIDELLRKKTSEARIIYIIGKKHGFGKKLVYERARILEQLYNETNDKK